MTTVTRRSFIAAGLAGAGAVGLSVPERFGDVAFGRKREPYIRYDINSPQGQVMLAKYEQAVGIMKGTPPNFTDPLYPIYDPRSWRFQWYTHWTDKYQASQYEQSEAYKEELIAAFPPGAPTAAAQAMWNNCQAHGVNPADPAQFQEWFFLPWHRLYLYFFEQIVRNVLGDDSFSLPYWNPASGEEADLSIPEPFRDSNSSLFLPGAGTSTAGHRYSFVNAGVRVDLNWLNWLSANALKETFYVDSPTGSFGFCPQVDINPHFMVHQSVGGDMALGFATVVNDPIFWPHHANIDRLWESWNRVNGKNPTSSLWLDRTFPFAEPDGRLVRVPVRAATRVGLLGYEYDHYTLRPHPKRTVAQGELERARAMPQVTAALSSGAVTLGPSAAVLPLAPVAAAGQRTAMPLARRVEALAPGRQLYLVLRGLQANANPNIVHGLYFDLPRGATPSGASDPHFIGGLTFIHAIGATRAAHAAHGHAHGSTFALNVTETLQTLNAHKALSAAAHAITIVPSGRPAAHAEPRIGQVALVEL